MSRSWIGAVAALLAVLGGMLTPAPAHAGVTPSTVIAPTVGVTPGSGDEMTVFRGTATGFTPGGTVQVAVTVNGREYAGSYTHAHTADAHGAFTWAWIWTAGDPHGSYTLSFTDPSGRSAGVGLTIANGAAPPTPAAGTDLMVDSGSAPSLATVRTWQQHDAPYRAIAAYVPVTAAADDRHDKVQAALDPTWVSTVQAGGWHVVPVYVGRQVPAGCQIGSFHAISTDPATALAQGVAAADDAVGAANRLGIDPTTPVVYDLEAYRSGCRTQAQALLAGWTARLHALGRSAGVYGAPSSAAADLAAAAASDPAYALPDLFWAATDNRRVTTSVSSMPTGAALTWTVANQFLLGVPRSYGASSAVAVDESAVDHAVWSLATRLPQPDTTAPIVAMTAVPATVRTRRVTFGWSGIDAATGVASYQVRTRVARGGHHAGAWGTPRTVPASVRATTTVTVAAGDQVCVQVRAVDAAGNASGWTHAACTSRLADDRAAAAGAGWHRAKRHAAYRHTLTTSTRAHAVLRPGHTTRGTLEVVLAGRGGVVVRVAGHRVGVLRGAGTHRLRLPRAGRLTLVSTARGVSVDGFVLLGD